MQFTFKGKPSKRFRASLSTCKYLRESMRYDGEFVYGSLAEDTDGKMFIISACQATHTMLLGNGVVTAVEVQPSTVMLEESHEIS